MGLFGYSKLNGSIFVLYHIMLSGKFLWFGNSAWDFWLNFGARIFWRFCLNPKGFFWVLTFAPIRSSLSLDHLKSRVSHPQEADQVQFQSFPA